MGASGEQDPGRRRRRSLPLTELTTRPDGRKLEGGARPAEFDRRRDDDTSNFCCCLTRLFLVIVGAVGSCVFGLATGLFFINFDENRRKTDEKFKGAYVTLIAISGCLAAANFLLVFGALCRNRCLVCTYIFVDTAFTIAIWIALVFVIISWEDWAKEHEKKDPALAGSVRVVVGFMAVCMYLFTCAIYSILMAASCSYARAL